MTDTTDYMRSRIIAHRDQPDIYDPPTREDMYNRILSDAETIKAARNVFLDFQSLENCHESEANEAYGALLNSMRFLGAAFNAALEARK